MSLTCLFLDNPICQYFTNQNFATMIKTCVTLCINKYILLRTFLEVNLCLRQISVQYQVSCKIIHNIPYSIIYFMINCIYYFDNLIFGNHIFITNLNCKICLSTFFQELYVIKLIFINIVYKAQVSEGLCCYFVLYYY